MSRADSKDSIICKLIDGGQKAVKSYKKISGSDWFDGAPEYFLTTFVGKNLEKLENTWVVFEVSVKDVKDYAKAKGRGRPSSHERKNGRFDIVLYWKDGDPRALVEIKSPIWSATKSLLKPDIKRICEILNKNKEESTLQFGAFLFYVSVSEPKRGKIKTSSEKIESLIKRIENQAREIAKSKGFKTELYTSDGENDSGSWRVACLVFC